MSKKKKKQTIEEKRNPEFDFSSLLTYCQEEEIKTFRENEKKSPVSSLLLNEEILSKRDLSSLYPDLRKDEKDSLLFRFDKKEDQLGKTLEHFGGGFYILDPSSASISYYLQSLLPKNFLSLDLCAAPGGKSISLDLRRRDGLYLANDISYERAIEIDKNAQRMQFTNLLTLSIDPMDLKLDPIFDLILLDVPCSGSGMIRKEPKMRQDYSQEKVNRLLPIQQNLLEKAYSLVKEGGILSYSTCSLSIEEDEEQIHKFLMKHKDMKRIPLSPLKNMVKGKDDLGFHMIPGIYDGEGIYFILLKKEGNSSNRLTPYKEMKKIDSSLFEIKYKDNAYLTKNFYQEISSLPYLSLGIKKYDQSQHPKCIYDHSYSKIENEIKAISITREEALSYIQGNEIKTDFPDGLVILTYQKMRLGLGKVQNHKIKNYLPKGLRGYLK